MALSFTADAVYSDGSVIHGVQDVRCSKTFSMNHGTLNYMQNMISCNSNDDEFGALTLQYQDLDFPETEVATGVRYIQYIANNIVSLSTNIPSEFNYDTLMARPADREVNFDVKAIHRLGNVENLTSALFKIVNGEEMTISGNPGSNQSNIWRLSVNTSNMLTNKKATIIVSDIDKSVNEVVNVDITGKTLRSINVTFINGQSVIRSVPAGNTVPFAYVENYDDGTSNSFGYPDSMECLTQNCTINVSNKTITINEDVDNELVVIKAVKTYRGKRVEQLFSLNALSNKPSSLVIVGNTTVSVGSQAKSIQYAVSARYPNGSSGIVTNNAVFTLVVGQPNLVTIDQDHPGTIIFKPIPSAQASFTFLVSYTERGAYVTRMITVIVNHAS